MQNNITVRAHLVSDPALWMDRIAAVFRSCVYDPKEGETHPGLYAANEVREREILMDIISVFLFLFFPQLWTLLCTTIHHYKSDARIVERACRCFRFILRCLKSQAAPLLAPLVTMVGITCPVTWVDGCYDSGCYGDGCYGDGRYVAIGNYYPLSFSLSQSIAVYQEHHHSCFLYLGSIVADEFGSDVSSQQGLMTMVESFLQVSLILLSGPGGLVNHPDTVDDMFRLCARWVWSRYHGYMRIEWNGDAFVSLPLSYRMVQRCPVAFLPTQVAKTAFECAKAAALHTHREAFSSVMKFFKDLIHAPFDINLVCHHHHATLICDSHVTCRLPTSRLP